jgi:hypothetical protein
LADLNNLAAHLVDRSSEVIDPTTPPRSRKPSKHLPPEFGQTWPFQLEKADARLTTED